MSRLGETHVWLLLGYRETESVFGHWKGTRRGMAIRRIYERNTKERMEVDNATKGVQERITV
jgi:hypothetical protein